MRELLYEQTAVGPREQRRQEVRYARFRGQRFASPRASPPFNSPTAGGRGARSQRTDAAALKRTPGTPPNRWRDVSASPPSKCCTRCVAWSVGLGVAAALLLAVAVGAHLQLQQELGAAESEEAQSENRTADTETARADTPNHEAAHTAAAAAAAAAPGLLNSGGAEMDPTMDMSGALWLAVFGCVLWPVYMVAQSVLAALGSGKVAEQLAATNAERELLAAERELLREAADAARCATAATAAAEALHATELALRASLDETDAQLSTALSEVFHLTEQTDAHESALVAAVDRSVSDCDRAASAEQHIDRAERRVENAREDAIEYERYVRTHAIMTPIRFPVVFLTVACVFRSVRSWSRRPARPPTRQPSRTRGGGATQRTARMRRREW